MLFGRQYHGVKVTCEFGNHHSITSVRNISCSDKHLKSQQAHFFSFTYEHSKAGLPMEAYKRLNSLIVYAKI